MNGKIFLPIILLLLSACTSVVVQPLATDLGNSIRNQDDPATVRDGAPAFMLLLDGMVESDPSNVDLLRANADLYATYATVFVDNDEVRALKLSDRALDYSRRALCIDHPAVCADDAKSFEGFSAAVAAAGANDVPSLYTYGSAWAGWTQLRADDWNALADLPRIKIVMQRVAELDEQYEHGRAHLYLGVLDTQLPPAMGGKPEEGRAHFEQAIEISGGRDLMAKVAFARSYARLMFDHELHDRLLNEVIDADPVVPGLTLSNTLAQEEARRLLASSAAYFEE